LSGYYDNAAQEKQLRIYSIILRREREDIAKREREKHLKEKIGFEEQNN